MNTYHEKQSETFMHSGVIRKIAVLSKDYLTIREIQDMFIFAGADLSWWKPTTQGHGSQRMDQVYGWVEGIEENATESSKRILEGVVIQLIEKENISVEDKNFLKRHINLSTSQGYQTAIDTNAVIRIPGEIEDLLEILIKGIRRAMVPLKHRRSNLPFIEFDNEYDLQDLVHSQLRSWVKDIRREEYTPSYAGSSTRADFLLAEYDIVIEIKNIRDTNHAKKIGDELILDIAHYKVHPNCKQLWIVIYDSKNLIPNPEGLISDLNGQHSSQFKTIEVKTFII